MLATGGLPFPVNVTLGSPCWKEMRLKRGSLYDHDLITIVVSFAERILTAAFRIIVTRGLVRGVATNFSRCTVTNAPGRRQIPS